MSLSIVLATVFSFKKKGFGKLNDCSDWFSTASKHWRISCVNEYDIESKPQRYRRPFLSPQYGWKPARYSSWLNSSTFGLHRLTYGLEGLSNFLHVWPAFGTDNVDQNNRHDSASLVSSVSVCRRIRLNHCNKRSSRKIESVNTKAPSNS